MPAVVMMIVIFLFSATPAEESSQMSDSISYRIVETINELPVVQWEQEEMFSYAEILHYPVRKMAHFCEYGCLGLAVFLPFGIGKCRKRKYIIDAVIICFLYACTDELHQLFVPGRDGNFKDVIIDTSGAACFILVTRFIFHKIMQRKAGEA